VEERDAKAVTWLKLAHPASAASRIMATGWRKYLVVLIPRVMNISGTTSAIIAFYSGNHRPAAVSSYTFVV
jgi:hypothetical protein